MGRWALIGPPHRATDLDAEVGREKEKFSMVTLAVAGPPGLPGPVGFDPLLLLLQFSEPAKAAIPRVG